MAMTWTKDQQKVIDSRRRNLLVSAAAGSGKTAVLVERIVAMITEEDHPVDLNRLLVMTFTNAAAAEMRERIGRAVTEKLKEDPENPRLRLQAALVPYAQIQTIDSFCLSLIRNHYAGLDIDPAFRVGDEGELTLLKADVMAELLEERYEKGEESFVRFVETYGGGKTDQGIEEVIDQVYRFCVSHPWPRQWLDQCRREFLPEEMEHLEVKELMVGFVLGFSMELAYAVIRFASAIMDYTMGLSMAQVYDPQYNTQMTITSGIYYALLSLLFLTTNGHLRMIGLFYTSARLIPFGEVALKAELYQPMLEIFKANIAMGLQLAFPLIAMELVTEAAIGILMRMIPQINVFAVNFQVKIIVGLMMMVLLFSPMADKMYVIMDNTFIYMEQLLQLMQP